MCVYVCIYMYELKLVHRHLCVHACIYACIFEIMPISLYICVCVCMYVCVYIYSNGNVLPSILVPVYVLYIFCYHTLLYGGNKEIYLSIIYRWLSKDWFRYFGSFQRMITPF